MTGGRTILAAAVILMIAAGCRVWTLAKWAADSPGPDADAIRDVCSSAGFRADSIMDLPAAKTLGVRRVTPLVFDRDAAVILCPGKDLAPGKASIDDDADGIVDNNTELGAMYSDDLCLSPADDGYDEERQSNHSIVISHGAYVEPTATETVTPARLRIDGQSNGESWQRLVVIPDSESW